MRITFISSVHVGKHWSLYGRKFIESFAKYMPSAELHVTVEGGVPENKSSNVTFYEMEKDQSAEMKRMWNFIEKQEMQDHPSDFRRQAARFARKAYTLALFLGENSPLKNSDYVVWLDADTYLFKAFDARFFKKVLPSKDDMCSALQRKGTHSETGFVCYSNKNKILSSFIKTFINLYDTHELFELKEQHDAFLFDVACKRLNVNVKDLNESGELSHPFNASVLGEYMDHLKGARKKKGKSPEVFRH